MSCSKFLTHCVLITLNNGLVDIVIWAEYRRTSTASKRADGLQCHQLWKQGLHPAVPANDHMGHAQLMSHPIYKRQCDENDKTQSTWVISSAKSARTIHMTRRRNGTSDKNTSAYTTPLGFRMATAHHSTNSPARSARPIIFERLNGKRALFPSHRGRAHAVLEMVVACVASAEDDALSTLTGRWSTRRGSYLNRLLTKKPRVNVVDQHSPQKYGLNEAEARVHSVPRRSSRTKYHTS